MNDRAHIHVTKREHLPAKAAALINAGLGTSTDAAAPLHEVRPLSCFARNEDNAVDMNVTTLEDARSNFNSTWHGLWRYARQMVRSLLPLLGLYLSACVSAAEYSQKAFLPSENLCKPPSAVQANWLDPTWTKYLKYIRVCSITAADGHRSLIMLISVWADLYYSDQTISIPDAELPKPLLVNSAGTRLGELPVNFPSDPPAELTLYFSDWRKGLPNRIDLCVVSPTASGSQRLSPLKYIQKAERYESVSESGLKSQLKDCHGN